MTLITKEDKDNYNSVVTDINQKISGLVDNLENLIKLSEDNSGKASEQLSVLIRKADKLKTYVNGLLVINKQLDANMPDSCSYEWVYTEAGYDCAEEDSACGEYCGNSCSYDSSESCSYSGDDCGDCSYSGDDCGESSCTFE